VKQGSLQALWSIEVKVRQQSTDYGVMADYKTVEWMDPGVVRFGRLLSDREKDWVVGEVLAWLEQVRLLVVLHRSGSGWEGQ
jgi:hypothetical protein